uniref:Venom peptide HtfTx1 n=1 Tax=Hadogenes troglodytes TaxID=1577150 RepID=A0A1B3IJ23_9SCOR|nr:venom peptide HtfTx1 [Hadogenes troglodytes]
MSLVLFVVFVLSIDVAIFCLNEEFEDRIRVEISPSAQFNRRCWLNVGTQLKDGETLHDVARCEKKECRLIDEKAYIVKYSCIHKLPSECALRYHGEYFPRCCPKSSTCK